MARSSRLRILPLGFFGSSSTITTYFGALNAASRSRVCAMISAGSVPAPSRSTTAAATASIHSGCFTPNTATSETAGCS